MEPLGKIAKSFWKSNLWSQHYCRKSRSEPWIGIAWLNWAALTHSLARLGSAGLSSAWVRAFYLLFYTLLHMQFLWVWSVKVKVCAAKSGKIKILILVKLCLPLLWCIALIHVENLRTLCFSRTLRMTKQNLQTLFLITEEHLRSNTGVPNLHDDSEMVLVPIPCSSEASSSPSSSTKNENRHTPGKWPCPIVYFYLVSVYIVCSVFYF